MKLLIILSALLLVSAVNEGYAQTESNASLPNFDNVVTIDAPVIVYRDYSRNNRFYIIPQKPLNDSEWQLSLIYSESGRQLIGNATVNGDAILDDDGLASIKQKLERVSPNPDVIVIQPKHSEFRVRLFGYDEVITDRFVVNPIGEKISLTFPVEDLAVRSLLYDTSYQADVGVISFKFMVRGVELDESFAPRIARRWFNTHAAVVGNCLLQPERFLDVGEGKVGCKFNIRLRPADIRFVQSFLKDTGYYNAPVDGVVGKFTRQAIRRFQSDNDMFVDGLVSLRLVDHLAQREAEEVLDEIAEVRD